MCLEVALAFQPPLIAFHTSILGQLAGLTPQQNTSDPTLLFACVLALFNPQREQTQQRAAREAALLQSLQPWHPDRTGLGCP